MLIKHDKIYVADLYSVGYFWSPFSLNEMIYRKKTLYNKFYGNNDYNVLAVNEQERDFHITLFE